MRNAGICPSVMALLETLLDTCPYDIPFLGACGDAFVPSVHNNNFNIFR